MTDAKPDSAAALVAKLLARARNGSLRPSENARAFDALTNLRAAHFGLVLEALEAEDALHTHSHGEVLCSDPLGCPQFAELYQKAMTLRPEALATVAAAAKEALSSP